jgi:hypothetical protein
MELATNQYIVMLDNLFRRAENIHRSPTLQNVEQAIRLLDTCGITTEQTQLVHKMFEQTHYLLEHGDTISATNLAGECVAIISLMKDRAIRYSWTV